MTATRLFIGTILALFIMTSVSQSRYREGVRYDKPPQRPSISSWPKGLAEVIADKSYLDGFNYPNPGLVTTNVDTFYYGGDTKALNLYLEKLSKIKGLNISVEFCKGPGKVNRFLRAGILFQETVLGMELTKLDGQPCSWLASITPKDWVRDSKALSELRIVIFLGDKRIDMDQLHLPKWDS